MIAGENIEEVSSITDMGGSITQKGLSNAFKRAKKSGVFIVQNGGIKVFPEELCDFMNYKPADSEEGWWEGN
jgi:hypothetical protein